MTSPSRCSICDSATPARSIATLSSHLRITKPSSVRNRRADFSALTSAITSAASAWPSCTPPEFHLQDLSEYARFVVETFQTPSLIQNELACRRPQPLRKAGLAPGPPTPWPRAPPAASASRRDAGLSRPRRRLAVRET